MQYRAIAASLALACTLPGYSLFLNPADAATSPQLPLTNVSNDLSIPNVQQIALAEQSETTPTPFAWLHGASVEQIRTQIDNGYRIVDLEVEQTSPYRFSVAMVRNQGVHAKRWWWYYGLTSEALQARLSEHQARIIDLQVYRVNGQKRYAVVLVSNTGSDAKAWWYYTDLSLADVMARASDNQARIVDLDTYMVGNQRLYSAVMIRNTGADQKGWWVYANVSPDVIRSRLSQNNARLVDIERHGNNTFTVVMERSQGERWWWYHGITAARVNELWRQNGARIFDIEPYTVNGQKRFAVLMLNNSNSLTSRIGGMMRDNTNGAVGLHLRQINGPVLASLQSDRVFYPASTIKVLEHLHAMRSVETAAGLDSQSLRVYPNTADSCSNNHAGQSFNTETLRQALTRMMQASNNQSTNAVQEFFGNSNASAGRNAMNQTARNVVGMSNNTALNHKFACGGPNNNPANQLTLADISLLYQQVATNANVLRPALRPTFYQLMPNQTNDFFIASVINEEASRLGLPAATVQSFRTQVQMAHKAGNIGQTHISIAGWVQLPFRQGTQTVPRQYTYGLFVDNATQNSVNLRTVSGELLRDEIRAALRSFQN